MDANRKKLIVGALLLIVMAIGYWYFTRIPKDSCEYYETLKINDAAMAPFLSPEVEVKWYPNHYNCSPVVKGDLVLYQLGEPAQKLIRIAAAVGGDEISLYGDRKKRGWNLTVNENMFMAGEFPYAFGIPNVNPVMNLYLMKGMKKLNPDELILFATIPPGYNDSGLYGIFSTRAAIKGRILLPNKLEGSWKDYQSKMYSEDEGKETRLLPELLPEKQLAKQHTIPSHVLIPQLIKNSKKGKSQKRR